MRYYLPFVMLCLIACVHTPTDIEINEARYSADQKGLDRIMKRFKAAQYNAPNEIVKKENRVKYLDTIKHYLQDSLHFALRNFSVILDDVNTHDLGNTQAFTATLYDNSGEKYTSVNNTKYWIEIDYPKSKAPDLEKIPSYSLLKNIPAHTDTTMSFFYIGEAEIDDNTSDQLNLRVIALPKDFNFDSVIRMKKKP